MSTAAPGSRYRVLLTNAIAAEAMTELARHAEVIVPPNAQADTLRAAIRGAHALIVRLPLPADIFAHAPNLLGVIRHGVGMDLIPVAAATELGIVAANVPGMNANAVAEYCIMAMLNLLRRPERADRELRKDGWDKSRARATHGHELGARSIGIIGHGAIGSRLAQIAHFGFGARVLIVTRRPDSLPSWAKAAELAALAEQADFIVPCVPFEAATRHLISRELIGKMKSSAFVVNAARGEVIDEIALTAALAAGRIAGAALDVFEGKILSPDNALNTFDQVLLTPHVAGHTAEAGQKNGEQAVAETIRILHGERPLNLVNPEVWERAQARRKALGFV